MPGGAGAVGSELGPRGAVLSSGRGRSSPRGVTRWRCRCVGAVGSAWGPTPRSGSLEGGSHPLLLGGLEVGREKRGPTPHSPSLRSAFEPAAPCGFDVSRSLCGASASLLAGMGRPLPLAPGFCSPVPLRRFVCRVGVCEGCPRAGQGVPGPARWPAGLAGLRVAWVALLLRAAEAECLRGSPRGPPSSGGGGCRPRVARPCCRAGGPPGACGAHSPRGGVWPWLAGAVPAPAVPSLSWLGERSVPLPSLFERRVRCALLCRSGSSKGGPFPRVACFPVKEKMITDNS